MDINIATHNASISSNKSHKITYKYHIMAPLLGTKFITYFVYNQIFTDKDVIFIHLMGSAFSAVTDRDCRLCRARSSECCNAFFNICSEAKNKFIRKHVFWAEPEGTICVNPFSCLPHRRRPLHNPIQKYLTIVAHGTLGAGDIDCLIGVFFEGQWVYQTPVLQIGKCEKLWH